MSNSFIHSPGFGLIIILTAVLVAVIVIRHSNRKLEQKRRQAAAAAPTSRPGLKVGETLIRAGDNWQVVCPDCGAFNVFHRQRDLECRHCHSELVIMAGRQGGMRDPVGVISRATQKRNDRVLWVCRDRQSMSGAATWSPAVFKDLPDQALRDINPETDMDWADLHPYMPIVCPSCDAEPLADCPDCLRAGFRTVPLAEWSLPEARRLSAAGLRYLRYAYAERSGGLPNARETHFSLFAAASRGFGPMVLSGARQQLDPSVFKAAAGGPVQGEAAAPATPSHVSMRDSERAPVAPQDDRGRHVGGYQPLPDPEGRTPNPPPRKP